MKLKFLHIQADNSKYSDEDVRIPQVPNVSLFRKKTGQMETLYLHYTSFLKHKRSRGSAGYMGIASQIYLRGNPRIPVKACFLAWNKTEVVLWTTIKLGKLKVMPTLGIFLGVSYISTGIPVYLTAIYTIVAPYPVDSYDLATAYPVGEWVIRPVFW